MQYQRPVSRLRPWVGQPRRPASVAPPAASPALHSQRVTALAASAQRAPSNGVVIRRSPPRAAQLQQRIPRSALIATARLAAPFVGGVRRTNVPRFVAVVAQRLVARFNVLRDLSQHPPFKDGGAVRQPVPRFVAAVAQRLVARFVVARDSSTQQAKQIKGSALRQSVPREFIAPPLQRIVARSYIAAAQLRYLPGQGVRSKLPKPFIAPAAPRIPGGARIVYRPVRVDILLRGDAHKSQPRYDGSVGVAPMPVADSTGGFSGRIKGLPFAFRRGQTPEQERRERIALNIIADVARQDVLNLDRKRDSEALQRRLEAELELEQELFDSALLVYQQIYLILTKLELDRVAQLEIDALLAIWNEQQRESEAIEFLLFAFASDLI